MAMRKTVLFPAILAVALAAAACGSSEPETVTATATPDEASQPAAPTTTEGDPDDGGDPAEGDPADGSPDDGETSDSSEDYTTGDEDSGDSASSGADETDESSGESSSSSSDDADASPSSGESSSSSSDDSDASSSAGSEAPDSPDDAVSVSPDQIVDDGADISDPGPSNSGEPVPPQDRRMLAYVRNVAFQVLESWPMQVIVEVSGGLPNPCHELWWEVEVHGNTYDIQVWAVSPPPDDGIACAAVEEPFTVNIPLGGGFVSDDYTFIVNGESQTLSF